ncbi:unnamed protein product [Vicia faba]|uniref:Uncharacterized protein n=1 Tax=Vicia faba TaxID=3906 RepID=A0AAV1AZL7_VICFA|nr:unnamed protein product [Vicia faba]
MSRRYGTYGEEETDWRPIAHKGFSSIVICFCQSGFNFLMCLLIVEYFMEPSLFITCDKSRDVAHELSSMVWLAVIDNLEENHHTFCLLKHLAHGGDVFLPHILTLHLSKFNGGCSRNFLLIFVIASTI